MAEDDGSPIAGTEVHLIGSARVRDELKTFVGHCGDSVDPPAAVLSFMVMTGAPAGDRPRSPEQHCSSGEGGI